MSYIYGMIHRIYTKERIFELRINNKIHFFYLTRSQMKQFNVYLQPGLFVHLQCKDKYSFRFLFSYNRKIKIITQDVISFKKIIRRTRKKMFVYFDIDYIRQGVQSVINKKGYRMFLDLEFTLPPYSYQAGQEFIAEIIQYGFYLEDENGKLVLKEQNLVRPKYEMGLNVRTYKFLNLSQKDFHSAISYRTFYYRMKDIINLYQPTIYVWGKNDILVLEKSFEIHRLKPIMARKDFVNLMQIMKTYFNVKTDIGLFNAMSYFDDNIEKEQNHNAMQDANVTRKVFHMFQKSFVIEQ